MRLLVDTSVWSLAIRRKNPQSLQADKLKALIEDGERIYLIGPILQEILSGISDKNTFNRLKEYLDAFPLIGLDRDDFEAAARLRNFCAAKGVNAGTIDFLIASTCIKNELLLFTADKDFESIAAISELRLLSLEHR